MVSHHGQFQIRLFPFSETAFINPAVYNVLPLPSTVSVGHFLRQRSPLPTSVLSVKVPYLCSSYQSYQCNCLADSLSCIATQGDCLTQVFRLAGLISDMASFSQFNLCVRLIGQINTYTRSSVSWLPCSDTYIDPCPYVNLLFRLAPSP